MNSSARANWRSRSTADSLGSSQRSQAFSPMCPSWAITIEKLPRRSIRPGPPPFEIRAVEGPCPFGAPQAELEQDERQLLARIGQAAVLPIDDAKPASRRAQDVVGPQVAVAGLEVARFLHERLEPDELVAHPRQPTREGRTVRSESVEECIPSFAPDRFRVPGIGGQLPREAEAVDRGGDASHLDGVHVRVSIVEIDPSEDANLSAVHVGQHASVAGADDLRRRDARGMCGLLEGGVLTHFFVRHRLERLLHRERAERRREPPDLADLTARHGSRELRVVAEGESLGEFGRISDIEHRGSIGGPVGGTIATCTRVWPGWRRRSRAATG